MLIANSHLLAGEGGHSSSKLQLDAEQMKRWVEFYQREAEQYHIFLGEDRNAKLKLRHEPVFRWASPDVSNEFNGVIFVWDARGTTESGRFDLVALRGRERWPADHLPHDAFPGAGSAPCGPQRRAMVVPNRGWN